MKIVFVYPDLIISEPWWKGYYFEGLACLSAVARAAGHDTALVHVPQPIPNEELLSRVAAAAGNEKKVLIGFSATTNQFHYVKRWAPLLKKEFGFHQLCGGIHPTLDPANAIAASGIDTICLGDGEAPLVDLANALEAGRPTDSILGTWSRLPDGSIKKNCLGPLTDIDQIPFPHVELYPNYRDLYLVKDNIGILMGSRGCPYDCSYCCNRALMDMAKGRGKYMRFKNPERFIEEIEDYLRRYPKTWGFFFEDDIFGVKMAWLKEWAPLYKKRIGKPFGCNMRPNLVDPEMVKVLTEAGCIRVQMAIESGNDEIRNQILNRRLSNERLVESFKMFQDAGVTVVSYNMVGSPNETPSTVLDTIKLNAEINPGLIQHSITYPYAGTALYDNCVQNELIRPEEEVTDYFKDSALQLQTISRDQILFFQKHFKEFVRFYQTIWKLPNALRVPAERATDFVLTRSRTPLFFEPVYNVVSKVFKKKTPAAAVEA